MFQQIISLLLVIRTEWSTRAKLIDLLSYLVFIVLISSSKLFANGQYTTERGFQVEELLTMPRLSFKVDAVAPNFDKLWPTFPHCDVKVLGPFADPTLRYQISNFACYFGFLLIVLVGLKHSIQLIMCIFSAISSCIFPKKTAAEISKTKKPITTQLGAVTVEVVQ